ncbi:MAG: 3-deoxy-7-phosphoheptulonate synthase, partial [Ruminiclostridium sp.]
MGMIFNRKLPIPKEIKEMYPLSEKVIKVKEERDSQIRDIFDGKDDRFILVIGPCSADKEEPVLDYTSRLARIQEEVKDKVFIIPRIYTNKPRTTGEGYKGMVHQPDPTKKEDMLEGIIAVRRLH